MDWGFPDTLNSYQKKEILILMAEQIGGRVDYKEGANPTFIKFSFDGEWEPESDWRVINGGEDLNRTSKAWGVPVSMLPETGGSLGALEHVKAYNAFCDAVYSGLTMSDNLMYPYDTIAVTMEEMGLHSAADHSKTMSQLLTHPLLAEKLSTLSRSADNDALRQELVRDLWNASVDAGMIYSLSTFPSVDHSLEKALFATDDNSVLISKKESTVERIYNFIHESNRSGHHPRQTLRNLHNSLYKNNFSLYEGQVKAGFNGFEPDFIPASSLKVLLTAIKMDKDKRVKVDIINTLDKLNIFYRPAVDRRHERGAPPETVYGSRIKDQFNQRWEHATGHLQLTTMSPEEKQSYRQLLDNIAMFSDDLAADPVASKLSQSTLLREWLQHSNFTSGDARVRTAGRKHIEDRIFTYNNQVKTALNGNAVTAVNFVRELHSQEQDIKKFINTVPENVQGELNLRLTQRFATLDRKAYGFKDQDSINKQYLNLEKTVSALNEELFATLREHLSIQVGAIKQHPNQERLSGLVTEIDKKVFDMTSSDLSKLVDIISGLPIKVAESLSAPVQKRNDEQLGMDFNEPEHVDPVKTVEPAKPIAPEKPAEPVKAAEPVEPIAPEKPAEPVKAAEPVKPVAPEKPAEPVKAAEPAKPIAPEKPAEPVKAAEPVKPIAPEKPAESVNVTEPDKPAATVNPVEPVKAAEPAKPAAEQIKTSEPAEFDEDELYEKFSNKFFSRGEVYLEEEYDLFNTLWESEIENAPQEDKPGKVFAWLADIENTRSPKDIKAWFEYNAEKHQILSELKARMDGLELNGSDTSKLWFKQQLMAPWYALTTGVAGTIPKTVSNDEIGKLWYKTNKYLNENASYLKDLDSLVEVVKARDKAIDTLRSSLPQDDPRQSLLARQAYFAFGLSEFFVKKTVEDALPTFLGNQEDVLSLDATESDVTWDSYLSFEDMLTVAPVTLETIPVPEDELPEVAVVPKAPDLAPASLGMKIA